jgi:signal transduction histidine kinase
MTSAEFKERLFRWTTVPALAAVLAILAVLQYHWSGQVSTAARAQMQSNLETSLLGFRQDVSRELASVCFEIKAALDASPSINTSQLEEQFVHWQQTAAHSNLVRHIYVWEDPAHGQPLRFDPTQGRLQRLAWPAEFDALQQHLKQVTAMMAPHFAGPAGSSAANAHHRPHFREHDRVAEEAHMQHHGGRAMAFPFLAVDQSIPALIYAVRRPASQQPGNWVMAWLVIELNKNVLEREVFPELAQKYFRGSSGLDYHVAVRETSGGGERVIYASDPGFGRDESMQVDAALNLFGPPFGSTNSTARGLDLLFAALPPSEKELGPSHDNSGILGLDRTPRLEVFPHGGQQSVWQVVAKHKSGSVEAAVSGLRRRNLMASFGVLIVLGLTMALILIASQRARRLARLQMDFVAGVSHELRTPLAVISSAAENIVHGVVEDNQQLLRYGNTIVKQSRELTQLVEQVLQFAAIRQAPRSNGMGAVNLINVVEAALEATAATVATAGFTVESRLEPGLPAVAGDFNGLVQSLQNLITNAVKYGGENHWLRISARAVCEHGRAQEIQLCVEDHGIGISKEEIGHIFEPFYRSPAVTDAGIHGTGLGLALARKMVEEMGGRLTGESELGKGSSFIIHLLPSEPVDLEQRRLGGKSRKPEPDFLA